MPRRQSNVCTISHVIVADGTSLKKQTFRSTALKVKVSLCLTNEALCHEGVWGVDFLTLALVVGEWSTSRPGFFTPQGKSPQYPSDRRLGGSQRWSGSCGEVKILAPAGNIWLRGEV
jgi:hypothetical protein